MENFLGKVGFSELKSIPQNAGGGGIRLQPVCKISRLLAKSLKKNLAEIFDGNDPALGGRKCRGMETPRPRLISRFSFPERSG